MPLPYMLPYMYCVGASHCICASASSWDSERNAAGRMVAQFPWHQNMRPAHGGNLPVASLHVGYDYFREHRGAQAKSNDVAFLQPGLADDHRQQLDGEGFQPRQLWCCPPRRKYNTSIFCRERRWNCELRIRTSRALGVEEDITEIGPV
jgi:hypothetical protein